MLTLAVAAGASVQPPLAQGGRLRASDGAQDDALGSAVALSRRTLVAAAPGDGPAGAVYVYLEPQTGWDNATEIAKLTPSDGASDGAADGFGSSVAVAGDTIVVGAPFAGAHGAAYVYSKPSSGGWRNSTEDAKLTGSPSKVFDFGLSVSVSGRSVLVGAAESTAVEAEQGDAYVFVEPADGWVDSKETARLFLGSGASNDLFGRSVSISGDTAVIGAPGRNVAGNTPGRGAVYVFAAPAGPNTWKDTDTPTATLVGSEGATGDFLGYSVAFDGPTIVAGAIQDDFGPTLTQGSAYVFERPGATWGDVNESTKLIASDGAAADRFGESVAVFDDTIAVGVPGHDTAAGADAGEGYFYSEPPSGWASANPRTETTTIRAAAADDHLGAGIALSDDAVALGAPGDDLAAGTGLGSVAVFGAVPQASTTTLQVTKTTNRAQAHGVVDPANPGEAVALQFLRKRDGRFRTLDVARPLQDSNGAFHASFDRPRSGDCKLVARYGGDMDTAPSQATRRFDC